MRISVDRQSGRQLLIDSISLCSKIAGRRADISTVVEKCVCAELVIGPLGLEDRGSREHVESIIDIPACSRRDTRCSLFWPSPSDISITEYLHQFPAMLFENFGPTS